MSVLNSLAYVQSLDVLDLRINFSMNFTTFVQEIGRISRYPHTETFIEEVASERFKVKMIGSGPRRQKLMPGEEAKVSAKENWPLKFESSDTTNIRNWSMREKAEDCFGRGKQVAVFCACNKDDALSQHEFMFRFFVAS